MLFLFNAVMFIYIYSLNLLLDGVSNWYWPLQLEMTRNRTTNDAKLLCVCSILIKQLICPKAIWIKGNLILYSPVTSKSNRSYFFILDTNLTRKLFSLVFSIAIILSLIEACWELTQFSRFIMYICTFLPIIEMFTYNLMLSNIQI